MTPYKRAAFESFEDLEAFFMENLWGRKGIRSKVIGKVLLWTEKEALWAWHVAHACEERGTARVVARLDRRFEVHALGLGRSAACFVQAAARVLAFLALPGWCLSHFYLPEFLRIMDVFSCFAKDPCVAPPD
jgi:hypothetical protein